MDVHDIEGMKALKEELFRKYKMIDGLINAIGISTPKASTTNNYFSLNDLNNPEIQTYLPNQYENLTK